MGYDCGERRRKLKEMNKEVKNEGINVNPPTILISVSFSFLLFLGPSYAKRNLKKYLHIYDVFALNIATFCIKNGTILYTWS